jgi:uncharacterized RDD family membrane protein YckC
MIAVSIVSALVVGLIAVVLGSVQYNNDPEDTALALTYVVIPVVVIFYFSFFEGIFGTTLGKRFGSSPWQLAVVKRAGGHCGLGRAVVRALFLPFEANPLGAIIIWATSANQRIGDLVAGTLVVDRRKPHRITFVDGDVVFELLDGRRIEFANVTQGKVINWLQLHRVKIAGSAPDGRSLRLTLNFTREKYRMDRLRDEMESALGLKFVETIEWWRVVVIAFWLLILFGSIAAAVLTLSLPQNN